MCEYNDYDQYGEYFVAWFDHKPTLKELENVGVSTETENLVEAGTQEGVPFNGEYNRYLLKKVETGKRYHK